jgi:hypothetical protein
MVQDHRIECYRKTCHVPEIVKKAGYGGLAVTLLAGLLLVAVRVGGGRVASLFERAFSLISKKLSYAVGGNIRAFRTGLDTMTPCAPSPISALP